MSCGVGRRCGLDLELLWLWHRPAAVALMQPPAWEPPYAMGAALKSKRKKKEEKRVRKKHSLYMFKFLIILYVNTVNLHEFFCFFFFS